MIHAGKDDPRSLQFACRACFSDAGEKCTQPTTTGRKHVNWVHYSRTDMLENHLRQQKEETENRERH